MGTLWVSCFYIEIHIFFKYLIVNVYVCIVHSAPSSDSKLYCVPKVWPKLAAVKKELFTSGDLLGSIMSSMMPVAKPKEETDV